MRYVISALLISLAGLLSGCGTSELKAPCDYYGTFCGQKVHINQ